MVRRLTRRSQLYTEWCSPCRHGLPGDDAREICQPDTGPRHLLERERAPTAERDGCGL